MPRIADAAQPSLIALRPLVSAHKLEGLLQTFGDFVGHGGPSVRRFGLWRSLRVQGLRPLVGVLQDLTV
ncbi:hypothetical protein GCM10009545_13200 [Saccharopolyspora thermophila]|uniref:Transposase n=1 Tax=Saccharopolyspora thermophila TaxID=89367 RepID=A0ABN1C621_9PSEU